jgi:hypothetical protein
VHRNSSSPGTEATSKVVIEAKLFGPAKRFAGNHEPETRSVQTRRNVAQLSVCYGVSEAETEPKFVERHPVFVLECPRLVI